MSVELPETAVEVGAIEIIRYLDDDGNDVKTAYGYEGVSEEEVIGILTVVLDRMREGQRFAWDSPATLYDQEDDDEEIA